MKINLKQFIFLLFISLLFTPVEGISCPKYSCDDNNDDTCVALKSKVRNNKGFNRISLTDKCKKGEFCKVDSANLAASERDENFYCETSTITQVNLAYIVLNVAFLAVQLVSVSMVNAPVETQVKIVIATKNV
jgi:hypothetical protein